MTGHNTRARFASLRAVGLLSKLDRSSSPRLPGNLPLLLPRRPPPAYPNASTKSSCDPRLIPYVSRPLSVTFTCISGSTFTSSRRIAIPVGNCGTPVSNATWTAVTRSRFGTLHPALQLLIRYRWTLNRPIPPRLQAVGESGCEGRAPSHRTGTSPHKTFPLDTIL
jgi:hypothetical protein